MSRDIYENILFNVSNSMRQKLLLFLFAEKETEKLSHLSQLAQQCRERGSELSSSIFRPHRLWSTMKSTPHALASSLDRDDNHNHQNPGYEIGDPSPTSTSPLASGAPEVQPESSSLLDHPCYLAVNWAHRVVLEFVLSSIVRSLYYNLTFLVMYYLPRVRVSQDGVVSYSICHTHIVICHCSQMIPGSEQAYNTYFLIFELTDVGVETVWH